MCDSANSQVKRLKISNSPTENDADNSSTKLKWDDIKNIMEPVVFHDMLENWQSFRWKTMSQWAEVTKDTQLAFRVSKIEGIFRSKPMWEGEAETRTSSIRDFTEWLETNPDELRNENIFKDFNSKEYWCYSSYNYMKDVFADQEILNSVDWSNFGLENRKGSKSTFWIGSKHAHTPCHQDSYGCNLVAQLVGKKLWILFPPCQSTNMYPTRIPYEESSVFSQVNILNPNYKLHPKFGEVRPYCVVLKPGEVLYVPPKWWHYVHSLEPSISVNSWIELESDDYSQLTEAVVRTLVTSFIPSYEPHDERWVNPNEELMPENQTLEVLKHVLSKNKVTQTRPQSENFNYAFKNVTRVPQFSQGEFDSFLKEHELHYKGKSYDSSHNLTTSDIINCFFHPNVISEITKLLCDLKTSM